MRNNYPSPNPFTPEYDPKRDFRTWVREEFPQISKHKVDPKLVNRMDEVYQAAVQVFNLIMEHSAHNIKKYYEPDKIALEKAYEKRDVRAFTEALDGFLSSIDWE